MFAALISPRAPDLMQVLAFWVFELRVLLNPPEIKMIFSNMFDTHNTCLQSSN